MRSGGFRHRRRVYTTVAVSSSVWLGLLCSISLRDEPLIPFLHPRPKCPAEKKTDKRPTARLTENHCGGYRIVPGGQYKNRDDERRECEHQQPILQDEFRLAPFTHNFPALETSWHFLAHRGARPNEMELSHRSGSEAALQLKIHKSRSTSARNAKERLAPAIG